LQPKAVAGISCPLPERPGKIRPIPQRLTSADNQLDAANRKLIPLDYKDLTEYQ
jgi:hypothetical protein